MPQKFTNVMNSRNSTISAGSGSPVKSARFVENTRVLVAMLVMPDAVTARPITYERNAMWNARWVTYAAPAARG